MNTVSAQVRNAFLALLDGDPEGEEACELAAKLLACSDPLPQEYADILELAPGATFAEAAQRLREQLGCR